MLSETFWLPVNLRLVSRKASPDERDDLRPSRELKPHVRAASQPMFHIYLSCNPKCRLAAMQLDGSFMLHRKSHAQLLRILRYRRAMR